MSWDELLMLLLAIAAIVGTWGRWVWTRFSVGGLRKHERPLMKLKVAAGAALVIVAAGALRGAFVIDEREAAASFSIFQFVTLQTVLGAALIGLGIDLLGTRGLSMRGLILEHHNPAGYRVLAATFIALALPIFAANLEYHPEWWTSLLMAAVGVLGVLVAWLVADAGSHLTDRIVEGRNINAGIRSGSWMLAAGAVSGVAVWGEWTEFHTNMLQFALRGVTGLMLLIAGARVAERMLRRRRKRGETGDRKVHAWMPAAGFLCFAAAWVAAVVFFWPENW